MEQVAISDKISASKIKWLKELDKSAYQITNDLNRRDDQRLNHSAIEVLETILEVGSQESNYVKQAMKNHGYSDKQTRTARNNLNVHIEKIGSNTYWSLSTSSKNLTAIE